MPKKFEQPPSPEELSKEFGELEQSLEETPAGKYMEGQPTPTEAELKEGLTQEEKLERSEKYLEAKYQASSAYTKMWKDYIEAKLAEGMTPEDIRDPGKLGYPKQYEEYDKIAGDYHKYFGPGDEFGMVDKLVEEAISRWEQKPPQEKAAREVIESLKATSAGKYLEGEPRPAGEELREELSAEDKERLAVKIAEKHFGEKEEASVVSEDAETDIQKEAKWEAEQAEGWEHLMNLPRAQSPKGAETLRLLNQFSRKYGSQNLKTGRAMLPGQKYPKGEPGMIGVYVRREKLDEGEG